MLTPRCPARTAPTSAPTTRLYSGAGTVAAVGAAMRQVADKLAAHGFDISFPEIESPCLSVTNLAGTTCDITVEDSGAVTWEYSRGPSKGADPGRVIALVLRLLTDGSVSYPRISVPGTTGSSLQGIVGRALKAKGMEVTLDVYADHISFDVWGEIVVTNPARPERGRIRVGDEPGLMWQTGCDSAASNDTGAIADAIITTLAEDIADGYIQRGEPDLADNGRGPA